MGEKRGEIGGEMAKNQLIGAQTRKIIRKPRECGGARLHYALRKRRERGKFEVEFGFW